MPTATPFNNLITFSRGSNATVTGSNGLIQWAPNNLVTNSEQFDNAAWSKGANASVTANAAVAPDGTLTADRITFSADVASADIFQSVTSTAGLTYTASIYVWADVGEATTVTIQLQNGSGVAIASIANVPISTSFSRLTLTATATDATVRLRVTRGTGMGAKSLYLWGAQLELGSTATTYNPTTVKNLLGFSEAFDNAAWTKTAASIVTGAQANPVNGAFNAQKLMEDTSTGLHFAAQAATTAAAPHTFSCYAKAAGRNFIFLYNPATNISLSVDLTTGATGQASGTAAPTASSAVNVGNGWYRVSMTLTTTAASNNFRVYLGQSLTGTGSYTGDGNSGVYIYGAQLSDSASLDPYVPTPGAAPSSTAFYGPRFDFDPVTLQPRGLLVEEQRTNIYTNSNNLSGWTSAGFAIASSNNTSPAGTNDALLVQPNAGNEQHYRLLSVGSAGARAVSFYAKHNAGAYRFRVAPEWMASGTPMFVDFDLSTGTISAQSNATGTITPVGNGWYRCTAVATIVTPTWNGVYVVSPTGVVTWDTGGTVSFYLWGAQNEAGAFATSYIPTVASTVTRSADVATISGSLFSQWFNQSEGSWAFDFGPFNFSGVIAGTAPYDTAIGAVTNGVRAGKQFSIQNFTGWVVQNKTGTPVGSTAIAGSAAFAPLTGPAAAQKLAVFQSPSAAGGSINGSAVTTTTITAAPTGTADLFYINPLMNGWLRNIRYIPARAADFQLQGLST